MGAGPHSSSSDDTPIARRTRLERLGDEARRCELCPRLAAARTTVVFGTGDRDAALMLVGAPPEDSEDRQGLPLVGAAGRLLTELLAELGLQRDEVYLTSILKCHLPQNREPRAEELAHCRRWLDEQVAAVEPRVVCSLGNLATKALRGEPAGIRQLSGRPETRTIGGRAVRLLPLLHPAAALYERTILDRLRTDLVQLPGLLALPAPEQPQAVVPEPAPADAAVSVVAPARPRQARSDKGRSAAPEPTDGGAPPADPPGQMELF